MENPAYYAGIPLLILGLIGLFGTAALMLAPERAGAGGVAVGRRPSEHAGAHPGPAEYVNIGAVLAIVTAIEVVVYYIDALSSVLVPLLLMLSALKFTLVVLWFMHLKFDNRLFSTLFTGGFILAAGVFIVVLATLGASLR